MLRISALCDRGWAHATRFGPRWIGSGRHERLLRDFGVAMHGHGGGNRRRLPKPGQEAPSGYSSPRRTVSGTLQTGDGGTRGTLRCRQTEGLRSCAATAACDPLEGGVVSATPGTVVLPTPPFGIARPRGRAAPGAGRGPMGRRDPTETHLFHGLPPMRSADPARLPRVWRDRDLPRIPIADAAVAARAWPWRGDSRSGSGADFRHGRNPGRPPSRRASAPLLVNWERPGGGASGGRRDGRVSRPAAEAPEHGDPPFPAGGNKSACPGLGLCFRRPAGSGAV